MPKKKKQIKDLQKQVEDLSDELTRKTCIIKRLEKVIKKK